KNSPKPADILPGPTRFCQYLIASLAFAGWIGSHADFGFKTDDRVHRWSVVDQSAAEHQHRVDHGDGAKHQHADDHPLFDTDSSWHSQPSFHEAFTHRPRSTPQPLLTK